MTDTAAPTTAEAPKEPSALLTRAQKATGSARKREGMEAWVFGIRDEVAELLTGSPFEVDSYLQAVFREVSKSKQLRASATEAGETLLGAVMLGATLQLPIGGPLGQFYLTPRNENVGSRDNPTWRTATVPMIGYRGFFELGYRTGRIRAYDYIIRRVGDTWAAGGNSARGKFFEWEQFEGGEFDEHDADGNVRALTGVVALAHTLGSDEPTWQFLSRAAIDRRKPKKTANTPWDGPHAEAMYVKTPHRELAKYLQLSIASAQAVEADEHIAMWNRATQAIETDHAEDSQPALPAGADTPADDRVETPDEQAAREARELAEYERWSGEQARLAAERGEG